MFKMTSKNIIADVIKDLDKTELKRRTEAAQHLVRVMKAKVNKRGKSVSGGPPSRVTGDLFRGIVYKNLEHVTYAGLGPPAYHGHLLEFGTKERKTKKGPGSGPRGSGHVEPRPFVFPTFQEEAPAVEEILSRQWM